MHVRGVCYTGDTNRVASGESTGDTRSARHCIQMTYTTSIRQPSKPTPGRNRKLTGIALEPAVIDYLDNLAERMRMNRSIVLNNIVHEYARMIENRTIQSTPVIHA